MRSPLQLTQTHIQSDPKTPSSMPSLLIGDSSAPFVVFPPDDHENLHISNPNQPNRHPQPPPPPPLQQPTPPLSSVSPCKVNGDDPSPPLSFWLRFGFEFLCFKVTGIVSSLRYFAATRGFYWSFGSAAGVSAAAAMLLAVMLRFKVRRQRNARRRIWRESENQLMLVIKEKDKKINELLHQIAQMNQIFVSLHKGALSKKKVD